jgi:hypothetical protein
VGGVTRWSVARGTGMPVRLTIEAWVR